MKKELVILLVDDEERIIYFLKSKLRVSGYQVLVAGNGKEALEQFHNCNPDLIVLDLVMPVMNGFEFLKELRRFSTVPVIILSAKSEDVDKIKGLNLGADDYLQKPFNPNELIARIEAISRRIAQTGKTKPAESFTINDITVDFKSHTAMVGGKEEHFTKLEWALLHEFTSNVGRVITYEELLTRVWGSEYLNDVQILRTWINRLRNKLHDNDEKNRLISTVPKVGYIFGKSAE